MTDPADRRLHARVGDGLCRGPDQPAAEEARLAMPPSPVWYQGMGAVRELLSRWILPMGPSASTRRAPTSN